MKSLTLRLGKKFALESETIQAHLDLLDKFGYVWYGKFGNLLIKPKTNAFLKENNHRYGAFISVIKDGCLELDKVSFYYKDKTEEVKIWLKFLKINPTSLDVMKYCKVSLGHVFKGTFKSFLFH